MPRGNPNAQTMASARYQKKKGIIAKSYKIRQSLAEEFAATCRKAGVSQASKITQLMQQFIDEMNTDEENDIGGE